MIKINQQKRKTKETRPIATSRVLQESASDQPTDKLTDGRTNTTKEAVYRLKKKLKKQASKKKNK